MVLSRFVCFTHLSAVASSSSRQALLLSAPQEANGQPDILEEVGGLWGEDARQQSGLEGVLPLGQTHGIFRDADGKVPQIVVHVTYGAPARGRMGE